MNPKTIAKALLAGAIAGTGALAAGAVGDEMLSLSEWLTAGAAALAAIGVVYRVPNSEGTTDDGGRR